MTFTYLLFLLVCMSLCAPRVQDPMEAIGGHWTSWNQSCTYEMLCGVTETKHWASAREVSTISYRAVFLGESKL